MIVAFLLVGEEQRPLAERMVASVRRVMPVVPIVHMRDEATEPVAGVDDWQVLPWDGHRLMTYRLLHLARLDEPEALILDTDVIVQRDMRRVFQRPFDVALTKRDGPILDPNGVDLAKLMPYNAGVMFSKSRAFWMAAHAWCATAPEEVQEWYGDQLALAALAAQFNTVELPCDEYNYTPSTADEDVSMRAIVHYKGRRKEWMLR